MKKDIHPEYREVLFHDISVDEYFIINSTLDLYVKHCLKGSPIAIS